MSRPFQRRARGHFNPLQLANSGPSTEHSPQSRGAEKHPFRQFDRHQKLLGQPRPAGHLGRVPREVLVGLPWLQAAQPGHLWRQEWPEEDLEVLEKAP